MGLQKVLYLFVCYIPVDVIQAVPIQWSSFPLLIAATIIVSAKPEVDFEKSFKEFAVELYGNITESQGNENVVFSPASIQSAAVLAFLGAGGKTETDMASGLSLPTTDKYIVANAFGEMLLKYKNHSMVTFDQSIYIQEGVCYSSNFHKLAEQLLFTNVEHIHFGNNTEAARKINSWVEVKTNGEVKEIVQEGSLKQNTVALIVNVLYLKGFWEIKFPKHRTSKGKFWITESDSVQIDLMRNTAEYDVAFWRDLKAMAVRLPFQCSNLSLVLIVPNERTGLKHVEEAIRNTPSENLSGFRKMQSQVVIPKFKAELEIKLTDIFKKMGMSSMFHDSNFSGIDPNVEVTEIIHKAVLEVNEEGAEVAAVTGMRMSFRSGPVQVVADRPFMYFIAGESNEILFAGRFVKH